MSIYFDSELKHVSKRTIDSEIESSEDTINLTREEILMYCAATPTPSRDEFGNEIPAIQTLHYDVRQSLDLLQEESSRLGLLYQAKWAEKIEED